MTKLLIILMEIYCMFHHLQQIREEAFKSPIRQKYEEEGDPYYSTARLWDDGIIDPAQTRRVVSMSLASVAGAPIGPPRFGVFRM